MLTCATNYPAEFDAYVSPENKRCTQSTEALHLFSGLPTAEKMWSYRTGRDFILLYYLTHHATEDIIVHNIKSGKTYELTVDVSPYENTSRMNPFFIQGIVSKDGSLRYHGASLKTLSFHERSKK